MSKYVKKFVIDGLLQQGVVSPQQLEQAEAEEKRTGESLFKLLPRLGFMTQERMVELIAEQADIPRIEPGNQLIDPKVIDLVPEELARKLGAQPGRVVIMSQVVPPAEGADAPARHPRDKKPTS